MSTTAKQRRMPSAKSLWGTLRADPVFQLTLGAFGATAALYLLPLLEADDLSFFSRRLGPFVFLSLVLLALRYRLPRVKAQADRGFWNDLSLALASWWVAAATILFFPTLAKPLAVDLATSVLYAFYYVALLMAVERQPHRRHRWRPVELERRLSWLTVTALVVGLFVYFTFFSVWLDPEAYASGVPDLMLFLALDGYVSLRLVYLVRVTGSPRWRLTYALLAAATLTVFGSDLAEALALTTAQRLWQWDTLSNVLLYLPYVLFVAAARLRHHPFPHEPQPSALRLRLEDNLPGPLGQTMTFLLFFPLIHFACYELGVLGAASRPQREVLVLVWLAVFGVIAIVQYRLLEKTLAELRARRLRSERALHKTQKDLRFALEREQIRQTLRATDSRFSKAFRACPDVMAISRLADGRVLEVNDSCRRIFGYAPEEFVGRTAAELGVWVDPEGRAAAVRQLRRHGEVTMELKYRKKSGETPYGIFSARTIELDGETYIFAVTRDIAETKRREDALRRRAAVLEDAASAIWAVDGHGRVAFWNKAAERRFGLTADEMLGQRAPEPGGGLRIPVAAADGKTASVVVLRSDTAEAAAAAEEAREDRRS